MAQQQNPSDDQWMARALELARRGVALASPNPMVGAVLVRDGRAVGEGFHTYEGRKHAEVIALESAGEYARGATLYLNLEPCCHTGRTGPCTDALIAAGVRRVVAAMKDPNPSVAGRGFEKVRAAGVQVETGLRENEARQLNEGFACWITTKRPLVTMKVALTLDGRIAAPRRAASVSLWITSEESRAEVQQMRHATDAVLTGIGTVLADNPLLTERTGLPRRRPLVRVVLDSRLRLPRKSKLVQTAQDDVLVYTRAAADSRRARALKKAGIEVVRIRGRKNQIDLRAVVEDLGKREMLLVMIEGGARVNGAALAAEVVDKVVLFYAPKLLGVDGVPFAAVAGRSLGFLPPLRIHAMKRFGPDFMVEGYLRDVYGNC
jgi:diaminohydroxyphosphoribosylaminopyrimidine deaminase/5-amino-6-(5-phosphoribosylamino)uracil reductase